MHQSVLNFYILLVYFKHESIIFISEVVVAPPSCYLSYVKDNVPPGVSVSAQNCYKVLKGAYTGEIR